LQSLRSDIITLLLVNVDNNIDIASNTPFKVFIGKFDTHAVFKDVWSRLFLNEIEIRIHT
jgi:hypothetical protein